VTVGIDKDGEVIPICHCYFVEVSQKGGITWQKLILGLSEMCHNLIVNLYTKFEVNN
jgi:hypothetical protein